MNPELKAKWVAALRSGDYQQGKGSLKYGTKYCCLGVLDEVGDLKAHRNWEADIYDVFHPVFNHDSMTVSELIMMNDGGQTFAQIADWVEAHL